MSKEEKKVKIFFTKSFLYLRYQGCQVFLRYEFLPPYSIWFYRLKKCKPQDLRFTCCLVYLHVVIHDRVFLKALHTSFCTLSSIVYCFRSSFKNFIHIGLFTPNIISLYLIIMSLMTFSRSCVVFLQFQRGIFISFPSCTNFLFIYFTKTAAKQHWHTENSSYWKDC